MAQLSTDQWLNFHNRKEHGEKYIQYQETEIPHNFLQESADVIISFKSGVEQTQQSKHDLEMKHKVPVPEPLLKTS